MASNLKRSKRTVGKRLTDIQSRVSTIEKRPAAKALSDAAVATANLEPGAVGGWMIDTDAIYTGVKTASGSYSPAGSVTISSDGHITANKFRIDSNGDAFFSGSLSAATGTFSGSLSAATGTFSGSLSAATGTFSGSVTATTGSIAGFSLSNKNLYSSYSNVEVEMYSNKENQYVGTQLADAFVGGFFCRNVVDGRRAILGYNGTYVFDTTVNGGYSFYSDTSLSVCRTSQGRMWVDHSTDTIGRIRYTSAGSGSFPGLIVSERASLLFASGVVYTSGNALAAGTSTNKSQSGVDDDSGTWLDSTGFATFTRGVGPAVVLNQTAAGTGDAIVMRVRRNGDDQGAVTTRIGSTNWGTGSDYRLKENIKTIENPVSVIDNLKPVRFTWKADKDEWSYGFIAHELAETIPYAVYGEKDGIKEDGSPEYQQVDYSKLTPILTAGLKEVLEKVRELEAKVYELENKE